MTKTPIAAELRRIGPALVLLQALLPVHPARALPAALPHTTTVETSDPAWFARDTIPFDLPAQPLHQALTRYAEQGGHLITTYFSGVVDEHDHVWLGGYPGALRDLLGMEPHRLRDLGISVYDVQQAMQRGGSNAS